ncbi:hypothetical protein ACF081_12250 [Streptomyces longwoodensis]|uniref:hypothetical protein n=1 Tax=Streptomyces longwoodensis TaxID=68231 RepID=UPI0036FF35DC
MTSTGITLTLRTLHDGERSLERALLAAAGRHRAEHEFHHGALDVARWSHEHCSRLADSGRGRGLGLPGPPGDPAPGVLTTLREKTAGALGRRPDIGLLLLRDLCELHLSATRNSLHWGMLAQAAQATRDEDLLTLASECHPRTLRQIRWTNTLLREHSPQLLSSM